STAQDILEVTKIDPNTRIGDLTEDEVSSLRNSIEEVQVEGDLRRDRSQNIKRLMEIGSYRGLRHRRGLPVNGQRTKTNARTRKGPRRMSIAGKKKV
ncbi:MAG: 30S ribosomal protein S13, partial [Solirubrobacterales bacterium]